METCFKTWKKYSPYSSRSAWSNSVMISRSCLRRVHRLARTLRLEITFSNQFGISRLLEICIMWTEPFFYVFKQVSIYFRCLVECCKDVLWTTGLSIFMMAGVKWYEWQMPQIPTKQKGIATSLYPGAVICAEPDVGSEMLRGLCSFPLQLGRYGDALKLYLDYTRRLWYHCKCQRTLHTLQQCEENCKTNIKAPAVAEGCWTW